MDHLPKSSEKATTLAPVPYLENNRFFYTPPFDDFGARVSVAAIPKDGPEGYHGYSGFIQSWLYFGFLEAFFGAWKIPFDKSDFLERTDSGRVVTSKLLHEYLVAIIAYEHNQGQTTNTDRDRTKPHLLGRTGIRPLAVRNAKKRVVSSQLILQRHHKELQNINSDDVQPSIWDSIIILGATLARAKDLLFRSMRQEMAYQYQPINYSNFRLRSIADLRYDEEWCPHERKIFAELIDGRLPEVAYFSQLRRLRQGTRHVDCTESKCVAYQIDKAAYKTRHVNDGCTCEFVGFEEGNVPVKYGDEDDASFSSQSQTANLNSQRSDTEDDEIPSVQDSDEDSFAPEDDEAPMSDLQTIKVENARSEPRRSSFVETENPGLSTPEQGSTPPVDKRSHVFESQARHERGSSQRRPNMAIRIASEARQTVQHQYQSFSKRVPACIFKDGKLETVILRYFKSSASGWLKVPRAGWNLVAFSHVWADGLGNSQNNKLPRCQINRLQRLANSLYDERHHPVPFWVDTLMIPKYCSRAGSESEELRRSSSRSWALGNMEWVYKGASKVLVLDHGLLSLSTKTMQAEEIGAHLMTCPWSRRLWTLQEGCNKKRTLFQFADSVRSWPELHEEVKARYKLSSWKSHSPLPKNHPVRKLQSIDSFQLNYKIGPATGLLPASPRARAMLGADQRLYKVLNQVWYSIQTFLEEMTVDWSGGLKPGVLLRCMRGMYYRNCSEPFDEPLVLSSLLSWASGSVEELKRNSKNKEERYKYLFKTMDYVPRDVLFLDQARYEEYGCRWIPKSLLAVNNAVGKVNDRSEHATGTYAKSAFPYLAVYMTIISPVYFESVFNPATLIWVALPTAAILAARRMRKNSPMCYQDDRGITTSMTGLRIQPRPTKLKAPFYFELHHNSHLPFSKSRSGKWRVFLRKPGVQESDTGQAITELPEAEYCLLLDASFRRMLDSDATPVMCQGLLVAVTEWHDIRPGGYTRFEALALVVPVPKDDTEKSEMPMIEVQLPSKINQVVSDKWIVG